MFFNRNPAHAIAVRDEERQPWFQSKENTHMVFPIILLSAEGSQG